jgi:hypothetical protein
VCVLPLPFAHAAIGRIGRPASLRPLIGEGGNFEAKLARKARRDREIVSENDMSKEILVMPGLDPGIHPRKNIFAKEMDCRVKPGNDELAIRRLSEN